MEMYLKVMRGWNLKEMILNFTSPYSGYFPPRIWRIFWDVYQEYVLFFPSVLHIFFSVDYAPVSPKGFLKKADGSLRIQIAQIFHTDEVIALLSLLYLSPFIPGLCLQFWVVCIYFLIILSDSWDNVRRRYRRHLWEYGGVNGRVSLAWRINLECKAKIKEALMLVWKPCFTSPFQAQVEDVCLWTERPDAQNPSHVN